MKLYVLARYDDPCIESWWRPGMIGIPNHLHRCGRFSVSCAQPSDGSVDLTWSGAEQQGIPTMWRWISLSIDSRVTIWAEGPVGRTYVRHDPNFRNYLIAASYQFRCVSRRRRPPG